MLDVLTGTGAPIEGSLIVCESVMAEIRPAFANRETFVAFLEDWGLEFVPSSRESATLAGEMLKGHLERRRERTGRIVADFLIGAHASVNADRLLACDRGYLRDYFAGLKVWDPAGAPPAP